MAYGEFYVERQGWARWPRVLIMCRKRGRDESGNIIAERRRYVPEGGTEDEWRAEVRKTLRKLEDARKRYERATAEMAEQPNLRAEIDGLKWSLEDKEKALDRACRFIADYGSCPYDAFDLYEPWDESCYQKCSADIDRAECWRRWFEREGEE
jgi:hypothetical protein